MKRVNSESEPIVSQTKFRIFPIALLITSPLQQEFKYSIYLQKGKQVLGHVHPFISNQDFRNNKMIFHTSQNSFSFQIFHQRNMKCQWTLYIVKDDHQFFFQSSQIDLKDLWNQYLKDKKKNFFQHDIKFKKINAILNFGLLIAQDESYIKIYIESFEKKQKQNAFAQTQTKKQEDEKVLKIVEVARAQEIKTKQGIQRQQVEKQNKLQEHQYQILSQNQQKQIPHYGQSNFQNQKTQTAQNILIYTEQQNNNSNAPKFQQHQQIQQKISEKINFQLNTDKKQQQYQQKLDEKNNQKILISPPNDNNRPVMFESLIKLNNFDELPVDNSWKQPENQKLIQINANSDEEVKQSQINKNQQVINLNENKQMLNRSYQQYVLQPQQAQQINITQDQFKDQNKIEEKIYQIKQDKQQFLEEQNKVEQEQPLVKQSQHQKIKNQQQQQQRLNSQESQNAKRQGVENIVNDALASILERQVHLIQSKCTNQQKKSSNQKDHNNKIMEIQKTKSKKLIFIAMAIAFIILIGLGIFGFKSNKQNKSAKKKKVKKTN